MNLTFTDALNKLFFGVNVSDQSNSILERFLSIPQLHHSDKVARQTNLELYAQMETNEKAWSCKHTFTFIENPLINSKIDRGIIEIIIGETSSVRKLLSINWRVEFDNKLHATDYFENLKELFGAVSTDTKFEYDRDVGDVVQFSTRKESDLGIRHIAIALNKALHFEKFEIRLVLGNELMD